MADFDKYTQTDYGISKQYFASYDSSKATSQGNTIFMPTGSATPGDITDLKIVNGAFEVMTEAEKQAQADAWAELQRQEVEQYMSAPDAQIEILGAVVLEQINIVREALNLDPITIEAMKTRATEIAHERRGI